METRSLSIARGVVFCAALGVAASAAAISAPNLPAEHQQGAVAYRTGGIGDDEAKAMQDAAHQYPLALEFVARTDDGRGGYLADVDVAIRDSGGKPVLQTRTDGPFLLARLPPGHYVVTAKYGDSQRSRRVDVPAHGGQRVIFGW